MKNSVKIIIGLSLSLLFISIGAVVALYVILHKSLPKYDTAFELQGLHAPVTIYYDEYAVAHIEADNEDDLFFAQGFVHARERLWQMDISRRAAKGELAEILGESTLTFDKLFRTIGLRRLADSLWKTSTLSEDSRRALLAYTKGVNAYLQHVREKKSQSAN